MPEISRFYGIIITMYFSDIQQHHKPHIHAFYGDFEAVVAIDGELLAGSMPSKQMRMISGWLAIHELELYEAWRYLMFESNGIIYASSIGNMTKIKEAHVTGHLMMLIRFSTGEQRVFDASILSGEVFIPLQDDAVFNNFKIVRGALTWMNEEVDIAPEYVYENSFEYTSANLIKEA